MKPPADFLLSMAKLGLAQKSLIGIEGVGTDTENSLWRIKIAYSQHADNRATVEREGCVPVTGGRVPVTGAGGGTEKTRGREEEGGDVAEGGGRWVGSSSCRRLPADAYPWPIPNSR